MADEETPFTYMSNVHTVVQCEADGCDFEAQDYITAKDQGEAHHRETGHELTGEQGLAIWIGQRGREFLDDRIERLLGKQFRSDYEGDDARGR